MSISWHSSRVFLNVALSYCDILKTEATCAFPKRRAERSQMILYHGSNVEVREPKIFDSLNNRVGLEK